MIEITAAPIDHVALTERVRSNHAGAVCTFLGTVREMTGDRRTVFARLRGVPEMALKSLAALEAEARSRWRSSTSRSGASSSGTSTWARSAWSSPSAARTATRRSTLAAGSSTP